MNDPGDFLLMHVEDDEAHAEYIVRTLRKNLFCFEYLRFPDGEIALEYLFRTHRYAKQQTKTPDLILLDLRLPKINGLQVLKSIKTEVRLRHIPVIFLTTSESDSDLIKAYENGVNGYLVKPLRIENFSSMLYDFGQYWICNSHVARL